MSAADRLNDTADDGNGCLGVLVGLTAAIPMWAAIIAGAHWWFTR